MNNLSFSLLLHKAYLKDMDKHHLYSEPKERQTTVSEPVVGCQPTIYPQTRIAKMGNRAASFEEGWKKSLSIEQFREYCIAKLKAIQ